MSKLFPIMIDVEETALGTVLRTLNGMPGIAKLHLDLDGAPKKGGNKNGGMPGPGRGKYLRNHDGPRPKDIVIAALMDGPKNIEFLRSAFENAGRARNTVHSTLNDLRNARITESTGFGVHKLTDAALREMQKHQTPSLPVPADHPQERKQRVKSNRRASDIIFDELQKRGSVNRPAIVELLVGFGFSERTADNNIKSMKRGKIIKEVGDGLFELVARKSKEKSQRSEAKQPPRQKPSGPQIILAKLREAGGKSPRGPLTQALVDAGLSARTIDGAMFKMKAKGLLKTTEPGVYELTEKGEKAIESTEPTNS